MSPVEATGASVMAGNPVAWTENPRGRAMQNVSLDVHKIRDSLPVCASFQSQFGFERPCTLLARPAPLLACAMLS